MILRKLLRKSKHYVSKCSSKLTTIQTVSINPECKRHFSKAYCSPNDNNAVFTDFPREFGKTSQASKSFNLKKKKKKLVTWTVFLKSTAFSRLDSTFAGAGAPVSDHTTLHAQNPTSSLTPGLPSTQPPAPAF